MWQPLWSALIRHYFVEHPVPRSELIADINMDGLNLLFDFRDIVDIGGEHSSLGTFFRRATEELDVGVACPIQRLSSSFSSGAKMEADRLTISISRWISGWRHRAERGPAAVE